MTSKRSRKWSQALWVSAMALLGFLIGSLAGLLMGAAGGFVGWRRPRWVAYASAWALAGAAGFTLFEAGLDARFAGFVGSRPVAAWIGRLAGILFVVSTASFSRQCALQHALDARLGHSDVD